MITLEICAQSYNAAINAAEGGAQRIELCAQLPTGGLTPDPEIINKVKAKISIPVFVLIRPRTGDFVYSTKELKQILKQIKQSIDAGADGIVCGALNNDHTIANKQLEKMIQACQGLPFTFHRAFELIDQSFIGLDLLVEYGVQRILTGGKTGNAYQSREELAALNQYANGRITILAGSGVTSQNVVPLIQSANLNEVHTSAKYGKEAKENQNQYDTNPEEVEEILMKIKTLTNN
ncbi:MAG: copper homeostasis protein CutC [Saprospiraceae bacterium]